MEQRWSNEGAAGAKLFSFANDLRLLCFEVERGKEQRWSDERGQQLWAEKGHNERQKQQRSSAGATKEQRSRNR